MKISLGNFIHFYLDKPKIFMKCGKDPISPDILIRPDDFMKKKFVIIKVIDKGFSRSYRLIKYENQPMIPLSRMNAKMEAP